MKFNIVFLLAGFALLFSSCAKLPVFQSKTYQSQANNEFAFSLSSHLDKKSNVHYGVAHDDSHFYVQVIFIEQESLMKIMRGGIQVYFDERGKKKKDYKLSIEKNEVQLSEYELLARQKNQNVKNPQQNMLTSIGLVMNKITWDKNGEKIVYLSNLQNKPVDVKLGPNNQNQLMLEIKIPFSELPLSAGQKQFSVGIETGTAKSPGMNNGGPSAGMRPGGGMGGRGGGGMGGGGGRGGGMNGGGMSPGGNRPGNA